MAKRRRRTPDRRPVGLTRRPNVTPRVRKVRGGLLNVVKEK